LETGSQIALAQHEFDQIADRGPDAFDIVHWSHDEICDRVSSVT
jgi:hypothetical protein